LSPDLSLSNKEVSPSGRIISCTISHASHQFDPITLINIYAPANETERRTFFSSTFNTSSLISLSPTRTILLGDFNYSYPSPLT
ncbi:hypothetical protein BDB01DRAFT_692589, partial [Pilobolus umbonatus]